MLDQGERFQNLRQNHSDDTLGQPVVNLITAVPHCWAGWYAPSHKPPYRVAYDSYRIWEIWALFLKFFFPTADAFLDDLSSPFRA